MYWRPVIITTNPITGREYRLRDDRSRHQAERVFKACDSVASPTFLRGRAIGGAAAIGFSGATPIVRPAAYTLVNRVDDRVIDCDATTLAEVADVLATVIWDLQEYGLLQ